MLISVYSLQVRSYSVPSSVRVSDAVRLYELWCDVGQEPESARAG